MPTSVLRLPVVRSRTGLSRSTIYARVSKGTFPKPISLGPRTVAWLESEIEDWLVEQIELSRKRDKTPTAHAAGGPS